MPHCVIVREYLCCTNGTCQLQYTLCKYSQISAKFFLVCLFIFSTCFGRLCAHHQEKQLYLCDIWWFSFCVEDCLVYRVAGPPCIPDSHPHRVTNTRCHIDSYFSWWWAPSRSKHVEKRNKHTKKNCAPSLLYWQDYTGMHGQQNIQFDNTLHYYTYLKC
jgi:hypothetical protein